MDEATAPGRPTPELIAALRRGKATLRHERQALPLPEKVRAVIELQRTCLPLLARQRVLRPWERVWDSASQPSHHSRPVSYPSGSRSAP
jgi:hypothetical protein